MSWLDDILAGRRAPGLFSWSSPDSADDIARAAERAGWRFVHLDTSAAADKAGFLDEAARAFDLPDWFGRNWDAFVDSLQDVRSDPGVLVLWERWNAFAEENGREFETARDILRERAADSAAGPFVVLVREGAPATGRGR